MKPTLQLLFAISLHVSMTGCSQQPDCLMADTLQDITTASLQAQGYHLFLRTSGFTDKAHFYQIYQSLPQFDACGETSSPPVSQVYVDTTEGFPTTLLISGDSLELKYSSVDNHVDLADIAVSIQ